MSPLGVIDSSTTLELPGRLSYRKVCRSEQLARYRELAEKLPQLKELLGEPIRLRIVIDAERIHGCLRWLLGKRQNPEARTGLEEAIVSGTIVAVAPKEIEAEIEKYLPVIAEDCGVPLARAQQEWATLRALLIIIDIGTIETPDDTPDPKDLPYSVTMLRVAALAVYSKDRHYVQMGVPVINVDIDPALREYARASSFTLGVKLGSTFSMIIGLEGLLAIARCIRGASEAVGRLPSWAKVLIIGGAVGLFLHPKSRAYILERCKELLATLEEVGEPIRGAIVEALVMFEEADAAATRSYEEIRLRLPVPKRRPAIAHARAALMTSAQPLSLASIQKRMEADGYFSKSPNFVGYLRRLVRRDAHFVEVSPGLWRFSTVPVTISHS